MITTKEFQFGAALPTLDGARIRLRQLRDADVDALYAIFSDAKVMRYWSRGPMTSRVDAEYYLQEITRGFAARSLFQWGIARFSDDAVIGTCTLYNWQKDHARADIGYALAADSWGQGYASETLRLACDLAFGPMQLQRLEADVDPRNERSIRLLERFGFQREGLLRNRYRVNGEVQDSLLLGLLRDEYRPPSPP